MKMSIFRQSIWIALFGLGLFSCGNTSQEKEKKDEGFELNISTKDGEVKIKSSGKKLDSEVLRSLFPERIGWFKRTEYDFQNTLGLASNAEVEYTKGDEKIHIVVVGGAIGSLAGGFSSLFENEIDFEDSNIRQKTGEWDGRKLIEGYNDKEKKAFMNLVLNNKVVVFVAAENMSEWNFKWWWKRIDWKKLER
jgi:hypothetical protein